VSGISQSMGDAGSAMMRAQDKIAGMQARAGAMDELLASGALTDLSSPVDDIQAQLDKVSAGSQVDAELAALRAQIATSSPSGALPAGTSHPEVVDEATDAEIVEPVSTAAGGDTTSGPADAATAPPQNAGEVL
jgi:phage shock protein A